MTCQSDLRDNLETGCFRDGSIRSLLFRRKPHPVGTAENPPVCCPHQPFSVRSAILLAGVRISVSVRGGRNRKWIGPTSDRITGIRRVIPKGNHSNPDCSNPSCPSGPHRAAGRADFSVRPQELDRKTPVLPGRLMDWSGWESSHTTSRPTALLAADPNVERMRRCTPAPVPARCDAFPQPAPRAPRAVPPEGISANRTAPRLSARRRGDRPGSEPRLPIRQPRLTPRPARSTGPTPPIPPCCPPAGRRLVL